MGGLPISLVAMRVVDSHAGDESEHDESGGCSCWRRGQFFGGGVGGCRSFLGEVWAVAVLYRGRGLGSLPILYRVSRTRVTRNLTLV